MSNTSLTSKVTQSRGWTLGLGIAAAALAAILLIAYLVQYRSSVNASTEDTPVLVAKGLIPKGTSGTVIAEKGLFQAATLPKDDLKIGAISDPAYLNGRVAVADIFPGQQITTADVSAGLTDAIPTQLSGKQRAVAINDRRDAGPRRLRRERRPRRRLLPDGLERRRHPRPPRAERDDHARRQPGDHPRRRRARAEARPRVRERDAVVPPPARRQRKAGRPSGRSRARTSRSRSTASRDWRGSRAVDPTIRAVVAVEGLDAFDVQRSLPDDASFQLLGMTEGVDETVRALQAQSADIIVVACQGREDDRSLQIIDGAHRAAPDVPIIVLSAASPNGFLRRAFEVGAADMAIFPQSKEQLRFAMSKAIARRPGLGSADGERREGRLVCVLGPKGGTGKTLTSSNLAVALALAGQKVLVIDLDLQFGDVALCLGLPPEKTMYDLAVSGGSLDADKLADYVMTHQTGVDVLLAPARPDQASAITIELLRDILVIARQHYDHVVADTPPGFTAEVIATIDASSDLVMVGTLDSLSLKNTKLGLETLTLMDYDDEKIQLVLNRADTRVGISQHDVVSVLGREPDIYIPSDREIPRAVNEGVPIVLSRPQSFASSAFHDLAGLFISQEAAAGAAARVEQPKRGSSLSFLRLKRR